jgi:ABC-type transport system involved in multi-copper enzyme maturation permease subunit
MLVSDALRLFGVHPLLFLALSFVVVAPYQLIVLAVTGAAPLGQSSTRASTAITLLLLDFALVVPFVSALHVRAVAAIARGEPPRLATIAREGVRVLPVVAAAQIVADIAIVLGLFAFVIPGVVLAIRLAVVAQVAAVEGTDWMGAIRRGAELTLGSAWHVLGVLLITSVVTYGLTVAGEAAAGSHAGAGQVVLGIAIDTVTRAFTALTTAVLYYELRGRRGELGSPAP